MIEDKKEKQIVIDKILCLSELTISLVYKQRIKVSEA